MVGAIISYRGLIMAAMINSALRFPSLIIITDLSTFHYWNFIFSNNPFTNNYLNYK